LLTIPASASVEGPVLARDIIVFGRIDGQLVATEVVDLRPGSIVTGSIISPKLILHDGALFSGRVDPTRLTRR
jgi:cytoskeletal protein CcmA (bactofilin family)